jgi:hypothetical protein
MTIETSSGGIHTLFIGDTLPYSLHGERIGSNYDQRCSSLYQLPRILNDNTIVLSGHDLPMTGQEFKIKNQVIRPITEQEFRFLG